MKWCELGSEGHCGSSCEVVVMVVVMMMADNRRGFPAVLQCNKRDIFFILSGKKYAILYLSLVTDCSTS